MAAKRLSQAAFGKVGKVTTEFTKDSACDLCTRHEANEIVGAKKRTVVIRASASRPSGAFEDMFFCAPCARRFAAALEGAAAKLKKRGGEDGNDG